MSRLSAICAALVVAMLVSACGDDQRSLSLERAAEQCGNEISVNDPAGEPSRGHTSGEGGQPLPPSGDLRRFELHAGRAGVCARWTTAAPVLEGTELEFGAHGPQLRQPGGAVISYGHGFILGLLDKGPRVTYGLDRIGSDAPRVLRARVGQSGNTVSAFVPRAELDRAPSNMPGRPPFPYRGFTFEARVLTPRDSNGLRGYDFWPQERSGTAGYIRGRLCGPPCRDRRFITLDPK